MIWDAIVHIVMSLQCISFVVTRPAFTLRWITTLILDCYFFPQGIYLISLCPINLPNSIHIWHVSHQITDVATCHFPTQLQCFDNHSKWRKYQTNEIDQSHKSNNAPAPYPTILDFGKKCAHYCYKVVYYVIRTGSLWDLWDWSICSIMQAWCRHMTVHVLMDI